MKLMLTYFSNVKNFIAMSSASFCNLATSFSSVILKSPSLLSVSAIRFRSCVTLRNVNASTLVNSESMHEKNASSVTCPSSCKPLALVGGGVVRETCLFSWSTLGFVTGVFCYCYCHFMIDTVFFFFVSVMIYDYDL